MNAHVCLLVLVTAAFMAIWNADRPAHTMAASASASENANIETVTLLPTNLRPGTWHSMSSDGETFRITIEREQNRSGSMSAEALRSDNPGKHLSAIQSPDGTHWYFFAEPPTNRATARHSSQEIKELKSMGFHH